MDITASSSRSLAMHLFAAALFGLVVGVAYLSEPALGDDIEYWSLAFRIHEEGLPAWKAEEADFHTLRWPIWGTIWVLQALFGFGLISYYGEPVLYLAAAAALVFYVGWRTLRSLRGAWLAAILFVFHPLLDGSTVRPMPDLSEGFWAAAAFLCWLRMMETKNWRVAGVFALLGGFSIAAGFANRITGVFIVPTLVICTAAFYWRRFGWLVLMGAFAAGFVLVEALIYQSLTGDILHSLHANLNARGRKGTEADSIWLLPFRFMDSLWNSSVQKVLHNLLAIGGAIWLWRRAEPAGRAVIAWLVLLYLEFSCTLQGFNPPRALVRDGDRFLASLAYPMSVLSAAGAVKALALMRSSPWPRLRSLGADSGHRAVVALVVLALLLAVTTKRTFFNLGFISELQAHLRTIPEGARIFAQPIMRDIATLADGKAVEPLRFLEKKSVLMPSEDGIREAAESDQLWINRKFAWVGERKEIERGERETQASFAPYLIAPHRDWFLAEVITKNETPDLSYWRKRGVGDAGPAVIPWGDLPAGSPLPASWKKKKGKSEKWRTEIAPIPESLRGTRIFAAVEARGNTVEAATMMLRLYRGSELVTQMSIKPYLYPAGGRDFFTIEVPREADAFDLRGQFSGGMESVTLESLTLSVFPMAEK